MMRPARQPSVDQCCLSGNDLPQAIWMPSRRSGNLPDCYHGTPLQMVEEMARYMKPGLNANDAIDLLIRALADERGLHVDLCAPANTPESIRAGMFVCALLIVGVARAMPQA